MNFNHFFEVNVKNNEEPKQSQRDFIALVPWLPDGKQIILSGDVDTTENADRSQSELFIVDTNGDNFKMLLGKW
jgi:hypothetical protein